MKTNIQIVREKARALYVGEGVTPLLTQIARAFGLSVREFASIFDLSKSHAEDILKHRVFPSLPIAIRISTYFEVSVEELFGWRVEDDGRRRPLAVEDPRTRKIVRLNRANRIRETMDLVEARRDS